MVIEIKDLNAEELDIYARLNEAQLLRYYEPETGIFIAESPGVILQAVEAGYEPLSLLVETERIHKETPKILECISRHYGSERMEALPVYTAEREILKDLTGYALVRGLWGAFRRKPVPGLTEFCKGKKRIVILYDIVNPTNVGAIIRSAAALGMDGIIATSDTVNPLYRRSARVSMGTVFSIPWTIAGKDESCHNRLTKKLGNLGYLTAAMALTDNAVSIRSDRLKSAERLAIFLGTEGYGLPGEVIDSCDIAVKIPMYHGVDSLNVAAASAVCFWEIS
ncbi:MAG: RNA methyltransferase [Lachnospiraceae bacterium]|nr:RNA methyltransferase [Lachnospiraceae bacterium]